MNTARHKIKEETQKMHSTKSAITKPEPTAKTRVIKAFDKTVAIVYMKCIEDDL